MSTVIGIVAVVVALLGMAVAIGNLGYLGMLHSAAKKRGMAGASFAEHARRSVPVAGGAAAGALVALLLTTGGLVPDVLGLVLGLGSGMVAKRSLDATRAQFRNAP